MLKIVNLFSSELDVGSIVERAGFVSCSLEVFCALSIASVSSIGRLIFSSIHHPAKQTPTFADQQAVSSSPGHKVLEVLLEFAPVANRPLVVVLRAALDRFVHDAVKAASRI